MTVAYVMMISNQVKREYITHCIKPMRHNTLHYNALQGRELHDKEGGGDVRRRSEKGAGRGCKVQTTAQTCS